MELWRSTVRAKYDKCCVICLLPFGFANCIVSQAALGRGSGPPCTQALTTRSTFKAFGVSCATLIKFGGAMGQAVSWPLLYEKFGEVRLHDVEE